MKLNRILILQPNLVHIFQAKFGMEVESEKAYPTPGTPGFKIICHDDEADLIDSDLQSQYHSGVGIFLFFTKYSRPDL